MKKPKRTYPSTTLKVLFALSGNRCAFPGCNNTLIEPATEKSDALVTAHICHIYAISADGPRGKSGLAGKELNDPENLILLCRHHHGIVDGQYETYPADMIKEWKRTHEEDMQQRLSTDLNSIHSDLFSDPYFPTALVDQKIVEEIDTLRKTRFFSEVDGIGASLLLGKKLAEGELRGGTDATRSRALAWCARLLACSEELGKAEEYLKFAKNLHVCTEVDVAEAFIISQKRGKSAALKALASIALPAARSAALMVVAHHEGAEKALSWLREAGIETAVLDPDGKLFLLSRQFDLRHWDAARETLDAVSDQDLADAPALCHLTAMANLLSAVPTELRSMVLHQLPFQAATFPLASDAAAMHARRAAQRQFAVAADIAQKLGCPGIATTDDEYALWLELRDLDAAADGQKRLEGRLRDPKSALRLVPLGLQFGIKLDLSAVEQAIDQQIALHGGITPDAANARFALAFTQKSPKDVASYIDRHYEDLSRYLDKKSIGFLQIEMLSCAGLPDKAEEKLSLLLNGGLSTDEEERLRRIIAEAEGADSVELRKEQFRQTDALNDLVTLVDELEAKQSWEELCTFGEMLFERTRSVGDAEQLAKGLSNSKESKRLVGLLKGSDDLRAQSRKLQMLYCWALYYEGELLESRVELAKLNDDMDERNYRALRVNLGIGLGDWHSLAAFVEAEYQAREKREAQDLIGVAQLAHHIGSPNAKDLTFAAAAKGNDDAAVLSAAYFLATTAGWEDDGVVVQWLHKASALSGENGPFQKMTLKDLVDRKPEWDRRETETWQRLARGDVPMFLAGHALNRSLINFMLFPALANLSERDPRRRSAIPAYSGKRQPILLDIASATVGMDATALLTLSFLNLLDKALDTFTTVYVPHSTLAWLFEEKQKAAFHQPSRIREAHRIRDLLATNGLQRLNPSTVADSDLCAQVGDDLAMLIAEAEKVTEDGGKQRIVVRPAPVHRLSSLMEEEADLTEHSAMICGCLSIVKKLRQKGQMTADEGKRAHAFLQLHEKPWPQEPVIADGAILYLDELAMNRFLHLGVLEKLQRAGFTAVASPSEVSESNALISYEAIADQVIAAIERIRVALNSRIESGRVRIDRQRKFDGAGEHPISEHPTVAALALADVCDAVVIDDRAVNQHSSASDGGKHAAILSTLDLIDVLASAGTMSPDESMEFRTLLRRAGYLFVPVCDYELAQHLNTSLVVEAEVIETAELKAIRENLLCVRMSDWLQLPKEASWLHNTLQTFIRILRNQWKDDTDISKAKVLSDWVLDQIDVRGWVHRLGSDAGDEVLTTGRGNYILALMVPHLEASPEVQEAYWDWLEDRLLAPTKEHFPGLFTWLIEQQRQMVVSVADKDLGQGEDK